MSSLYDYIPPRVIENFNPPNNLIGACIFLYYITLAIFLTTHIIGNLRGRYERFPSTVNRRSTKVLIVFALVSFASSASHMINFLVNSYMAWRTNQILYKPETLREEDVVGPWKWMLDSSLFESFAKELVGTPTNSVVTQLALLVTWFWNVRLSQEAAIHSIRSNAQGPFIILSQILPISFSATLFIIYTRLTPGAKRSHKSAAATPSRPGTSPLSSSGYTSLALLVTTAAFTTLAIKVPEFSEQSNFIVLVLLTRLFLTLPYWSFSGIKPYDRINGAWTIGIGLVLFNFRYAMGGGLENGWDLLKALQSGPQSLKALGRDAVIATALAAYLKLEEVFL